jgi:hypothetical protein
MPLFAVLFLLQAAPRPAPPPPLPAAIKDRCFVRDDSAGVPKTRYVGDRACFDFDPARTLNGVWVVAFEGSSFHEGAQILEDVRGRPNTTWLSFDKASVTPPDFKLIPDLRPHAYRLTFVGKTTKAVQRSPRSGYGHLNMSRELVMVDQVTEWDLGTVGR